MVLPLRSAFLKEAGTTAPLKCSAEIAVREGQLVETLAALGAVPGQLVRLTKVGLTKFEPPFTVAGDKQ